MTSQSLFDTTTRSIGADNGYRCTDALRHMLQSHAGIRKADFDAVTGRLHVDYDPSVMTDTAAVSLVRQASQAAAERVTGCAQRIDSACAVCSTALSEELVRHYQRLAQLEVQLQPAALGLRAGGQMTLSHAGAVLAQADFGLAEVVLAPTPASAAAGTSTPGTAPDRAKKSASPARPALARARLEVIFTTVTLLAAIAAYIGQALGLPSPAVNGLYLLAFLTGGYYGTLDGLALLKERRLDVNLLMVLAALGAAIIGRPGEGATLLFLFSLSNTLQTFAMGRSRRAIEKLLDLRPKSATVQRGSRLVTLPIEKLVIGDIVIVRPGERFPIDGEVRSGTSSADQSTITGESMPVSKLPGDMVFGSTVNGNGALEIRVTRLAQDTTLARIVQLVEEAQANKAHTQRTLDKFEQVYAVIVLSGAVLLTVVPYFLLSQAFYPTFYRAMTWLVVASPCALVISTPASILSAIANGARRGILFKGGVHLEQTAGLKVIAFDKTGTLTTGRPQLNQVIPCDGRSADALLALAAAVESRSEHPLASAIVREAEKQKLALPAASDFNAVPGQGVQALVDGVPVWIGNERLYAERSIAIPEALQAQARELENQGQTVMLVYRAGEWLGLLGVADVLRPNAAEIVTHLKKLGIKKVVMLTGDNERVAAAIAKHAGVDEVYSGLLPQDKVDILKVLREKYGLVAMIGDGVNDAPALASADVGVAMGAAGTDVALETADVVLMADNLTHLPYAIGLARRARRIVWQNLAFSMGVIVILVISTFGIQLPLPIGVVGHEGSTVIVVLNGLRLLGYRGNA
jgi:Cd2+/Zn2+-exporting ATPase